MANQNCLAYKVCAYVKDCNYNTNSLLEIPLSGEYDSFDDAVIEQNNIMQDIYKGYWIEPMEGDHLNPSYVQRISVVSSLID